jgi:signal transduction histidine kinase
MTGVTANVTCGFGWTREGCEGPCGSTQGQNSTRLLADKGLAAALDTQARKSSVPVVVESDGIGRLRQDIEAAVYFSVLEGLQNVAKYAEATRAEVRLVGHDHGLEFAVHDNGRGFDPSERGYGTGLQGIADRVDALGGTSSVTSQLGEGTVVAGRIPVDPDVSDGG